jgi:hypothetical protein
MSAGADWASTGFAEETPAADFSGSPVTAATFVKNFCALTATPEPSTIPGKDLPSDLRKVPRVTGMMEISPRPAAYGNSRCTI